MENNESASKQKIVLENEFAKVYYDPTIPCIHNHHKGYVGGEAFQRLLNEILITYKKLKAQYGHEQLFWLADTRKFGAMSDEDQVWVREEWELQADIAGVTHMAFIVPEDIFGELSIREYIQENESFVTRLFDSVEAAKEWFSELASINEEHSII